MTCIIIMRYCNQALVSAYWDFPLAQMVKKSACSAGDLGSIPRSGRFPGEGNGSPLQCSCLGKLKDRAWRAAVQGVTKELDTTQQLNNNNILQEKIEAIKSSHSHMLPS